MSKEATNGNDEQHQPACKKVLTTCSSVRGEKLSFFKDGLGFFKDGYCRTGPEDKRHLSVAAIMTHAFHQSEYGDDDYKGISAGQKTCMSAHDFKACIKEMGP